MKKKIILFTIVLASLLLALGETPPASAQGSTPLGAQVGTPWRGAPGITETVAQIMAREQRAPQEPSAARIVHPLRTLRNIPRSSGPNLSNLLSPQSSSKTQTPQSLFGPQSFGLSFLGAQSSESGFVPPDSMGAVGPTQALVVVNGRIKVFDKTTGAVGGLNASLNTFFASLSPNTAGDPNTRYDRLSGRWFVTALDFGPAPNRILIAVSSGSTISSGASFSFYQFTQDAVGGGAADNGKIADYDSLGVDAKALYIGVNIFNVSDQLTGTTGFVINKSDLLSGTLTVTAFRQLAVCSTSCSNGPFSPRGVHNDDPNAAEGYFIGVDTGWFNTLAIRRISSPGGIPAISSNIFVYVPTTYWPMFAVPALGTTTSLDDIDDRLYGAQIHQNKITGVNTLWTAHNIRVDSTGASGTGGNRDGSRWYEIGSLTTTPALVQSGTLFDSANSNPKYYWMPSVAMSGQGHMALGASFAGVADYAGIVVSGRLSSDTLGTIQSPVTAQTGLGTYNLGTQTPKRWGDYSQTVVDPNDDMTMWTFQEYTNGTNSWGVRVIQLKAPPPAYPRQVSPSSIATGQASVSVVVTAAAGTTYNGFFDPGSDTGGPGFSNHITATVSGGVVVNSISFNSPTQVTLNLSTVSASVGRQNLTVTNPDGQNVTAYCFLPVSDGVNPVLPCPIYFPQILK